ncbi:HNH endonuclease [Adhaeribacter sp. BT258]|uniref:HNH endonuclease n=1 Tax=Adhaeribacter terrigena TaxID=2793070 RepID=A0ABS1C5V8_9BACT|nr:HNH endonuclease [Adhaeribacter terrigena]MBK0404772.1 HNH endonuclease [Adhaeribacter terrigena]
MDYKVLILNQDYSAISLCSVQKAFSLIYLEKAEMLEKYENSFLRSISATYPKPSVIRLSRYVHIPYKGIALSRHNIMKRDHFQCQYCGSNKNLTLDHVYPRSRGGKSTWTNLLTACNRCNTRKGDRTPEEAGFALKQQPKKPTLVAFLRLHATHLDQSWAHYLKVEAV